jgi:hypothetical protein
LSVCSRLYAVVRTATHVYQRLILWGLLRSNIEIIVCLRSVIFYDILPGLHLFN